MLLDIENLINMEEELNPSSENNDDVRDIAEKLGVNLDDEDIGKAEKTESNSDNKTDTETIQKESRNSESGKLQEDEVDYKKKYSESTKEFQTKYKPLEDSVKKLEQETGKNISEIIDDYTKQKEKVEEEDEMEKDTSKNEITEVTKKVSDLETKLDSLGEKFSEQEVQYKLSAKQKVGKFLEKYDLSENDYSSKIVPQLEGIKGMTKENGDHYTLEEALEIAYVVNNKDNIDKIVDKKIQIKKKEENLTFAPKGSKESSSIEKKPHTEQQEEAARRMGVNLAEEEK